MNQKSSKLTITKESRDQSSLSEKKKVHSLISEENSQAVHKSLLHKMKSTRK